MMRFLAALVLMTTVAIAAGFTILERPEENWDQDQWAKYRKNYRDSRLESTTEMLQKEIESHSKTLTRRREIGRWDIRIVLWSTQLLACEDVLIERGIIDEDDR